MSPGLPDCSTSGSTSVAITAASGEFDGIGFSAAESVSGIRGPEPPRHALPVAGAGPTPQHQQDDR
jgi:hypothetical protein